MEVYLNPVKYCKTPTGHPKGHPCCKIADYDDTAFGAGTLTVHPWRAGPDCGKFNLINSDHMEEDGYERRCKMAYDYNS